jgi:hypothetical protein
MILPMENDAATGWKAGTPERLVSNFAQRPGAVFCPDGRWLAYTSNESGHSEVYVRAFPGPGPQWQVSISGGSVPTWSQRRNELFYLSADSHLMVVSYAVDGKTLRANPPQQWSEQPINGRPGPRPFDVHPDGDRFVVSGDSPSTPNVNHVILVRNFFEEVRRGCPTPRLDASCISGHAAIQAHSRFSCSESAIWVVRGCFHRSCRRPGAMTLPSMSGIAAENRSHRGCQATATADYTGQAAEWC